MAHIHLDPLGGLSGDMFAAAMLDLAPGAEPALQDDLAAAGLGGLITMRPEPTRKKGFAATKLVVAQVRDAPPTRHWRDIRARLEECGLRAPVKTRTLSIFTRLAEAEAASHGVAVDEVHFHEIADWDSVADIVAAASLIESSGAKSWSVSALPMGGGRVKTQHGFVPVPAPATAKLLEGFAFVDDGEPGERITPTGAAILRHLAPSQGGPPSGARLAASGAGAGTRDFDGVANLCRVLQFEMAAAAGDAVAEISFEIDDMTPEEISVALDRVRAGDGVLDAGYVLGFGKKGRARYVVTVLAEAAAAEAAGRLCFAETSTLGLRIGEARRRILSREAFASGGLRVKSAARPGGATAKVESDDLAELPTLKARRKAAEEAGHD